MSHNIQMRFALALLNAASGILSEAINVLIQVGQFYPQEVAKIIDGLDSIIVDIIMAREKINKGDVIKVKIKIVTAKNVPEGMRCTFLPYCANAKYRFDICRDHFNEKCAFKDCGHFIYGSCITCGQHYCRVHHVHTSHGRYLK